MEQFPIEMCSLAALPLLFTARARLYSLAAPQASRIADRISAALEELIECAGDVQAYGNKWAGRDIGDLAEALRAATKVWDDVTAD